jgi:osmotically-inducible protein OsmY
MGDIDEAGDAVADELIFDPDVDASDITVRAAGGAVLLTGTVPSYPQYLAAVADARRVAGARNVRDNLEIRLPPGDVRDDAALTAAANDALTLNEAAPGPVRARAEGGDVILTGTVRDAAERAAAELLVAALTGVRRVTNDIEVRATADLGRLTGRPEHGHA